MRGVLIQDHEPATHRRQDVGAVELPELGLTVAWRGGLGRWRHGRFGRRARRWRLEPEIGLSARLFGHALAPARFRGAALHHGEGWVETREGPGARPRDKGEHEMLVREAHLALGRMDVHVHPPRWNREPQRGRWKAPGRQQVPVRLAQGLSE